MRRCEPLVVGQKFGRWEVVETGVRRELKGRSIAFSRVRCECGKERWQRDSNLRSGSTNGCGGHGGQGPRKHGLSYHPFYRLLSDIKYRLKTQEAYAGVELEPEWAGDPAAFVTYIEDTLGHPPSKAWTLDRIDGTKGYVKGNLRWADKVTQAQNRNFANFKGKDHVHGADGRMRPTHGLTHHPLFAVLKGIKYRLKNQASYKKRGITLAPEWEDPAVFIAYVEKELGQKPSPSHTIDRIDNDKGYEPGNIRWASKAEQAQNRTTSFSGDHDTSVSVGEKYHRLTVIELLIKTEERPVSQNGIHTYRTYLARCRCDCGTEVTTPRRHLLIGKSKSCGCLRSENVRLGPAARRLRFTVDGKSMTLAEMSGVYGISIPALRQRLKKMTPEEAVRIPQNHTTITVAGETMKIDEAASRFGVKKTSILKRLRAGETGDEAVRPTRHWTRKSPTETPTP